MYLCVTLMLVFNVMSTTNSRSFQWRNLNCTMWTTISNKVQRNLAKGDVARMQKKSVIFGTHIWGRVVNTGHGVSDGTIRKSGGGFLYRLSIVTIFALGLSLTIWPKYANECPNAQINKSLYFGEKRVNRCKPNFRTIWERWGCGMHKKLCRYLLPFEHNARTWRTDKQTTER